MSMRYVAAAVLGLAASSAEAVTVVDGNCTSVTASAGCLFTGNIAPSTFAETQAAYNIYNDTHPSAAPDITLNYLFKTDDGADFPGSITGAGTASGSWSTPGFLVSFLAVKAGNNFVLYQLATPALSGLWNTFNIPFRNNPRDLSHLAFFDTADDGSGTGSAVPEPATWGLMMVGFTMIGLVARRRTRVVSA